MSYTSLYACIRLHSLQRRRWRMTDQKHSFSPGTIVFPALPFGPSFSTFFAFCVVPVCALGSTCWWRWIRLRRRLCCGAGWRSSADSAAATYATWPIERRSKVWSWIKYANRWAYLAAVTRRLSSSHGRCYATGPLIRLWICDRTETLFRENDRETLSYGLHRFSLKRKLNPNPGIRY